MHWKSWPYWAKGAILFAGIYAIIAAFSIIGQMWMRLHPPTGSFQFLEWFNIGLLAWLSIPLFVWKPVLVLFGLDIVPAINNTDLAFALIIVLISWFLIGAIVGSLYGKLKDRRQVKSGFPPARE